MDGPTSQFLELKSYGIGNPNALMANSKILSRLLFDTCASAHARQNTKQTDKCLVIKFNQVLKLGSKLNISKSLLPRRLVLSHRAEMSYGEKIILYCREILMQWQMKVSRRVAWHPCPMLQFTCSRAVRWQKLLVFGTRLVLNESFDLRWWLVCGAQ